MGTKITGISWSFFKFFIILFAIIFLTKYRWID